MGAKALKTSLIIDIYNDLQKDKRLIDIARDHNIGVSAVMSVNRTMDKYLNRYSETKSRRLRTYTRAREAILKQRAIKEALLKQQETYEELKQQEQPKNVVAPVSGDPFTRLEEAQKEFDKAIHNFVISMVDKKVAQFKDEYEQLKRVVQEEKHSNLVSSLKKHFGGY